jgi:hypothetical protein
MSNSKVESKRKPPYVAAGTLWEFFNKMKFVSTPPHLDAIELQEYGIPKHWAYHLLSALKFLNLVEKNGKTTPALSSLQMRGDEFKHSLEAVVRNAYAELFTKVDPARDSRANIMNFFMKHYGISPSGAEKATTLFLDLCAEAGIPTLKEALSTVSKPRPTPSKPKAKSITPEISEKTEPRKEHELEKVAPSEDELKSMYLNKLIGQISPPDTAGKDAEAIKAEAELRKAELDRIEKLLGVIKEKEPKE